MSIWARLAAWLLESIKVPVETAHRAVDACDVDRDGFISLGELVRLAQSLFQGRVK